MARIRTVKPALFRNVELYEAEFAVNKNRSWPYLNIRFAFAGLFTVADREGRFKWEPRVLKLDCLPHDPIDFAEVLEALKSSGKPPFIAQYEVDGAAYGVIPGFPIHQRPNHKEANSELPPAPREITRVDPGLPGLTRGEQEQEGNRKGRTDCGLQELSTTVHKSVDKSLLEMRMPWGKEYRGVLVVNLPFEYAEWCLGPKNKRRGSIGAQLEKALRARIALKTGEMTPGQLKVRGRG